MLSENIIDVTERETRESSHTFEDSKRFIPISKVHVKYPKGPSDKFGIFEKTIDLQGHFIYDQSSSVQQNVATLLRHTYVIKSPKEINPDLWILKTKSDETKPFDLS